MSGTFDLLVFIKGRTIHEAAQFVSEKLATMNGVTSICDSLYDENI